MNAADLPADGLRERERPQLIGLRKFLADFKPIESIVDGLPVGRGALVSITAPTGHGKTTVCALLQACLRFGLPVAGRDVTAGSVLVLAGENPDDYAMHATATLQHLGIPRESMNDLAGGLNVMVVPGTFDLLFEIDRLHSMISAAIDNLVAVFVDTSAAFFNGADENDNAAMRKHASALREFTTLPGNPTVFVLCHPTKNATADHLLPRGGGSFLAEVDANLTLWKDAAGIVSLHWAGKIRGASFEPIRFELVPIQLEGVVDSRGRPIFSVAARHLPDDKAEQIEAKELDDENRLLVAMAKKTDASIADLALAAGFTSGMGAPQKSKVSRLLDKLVGQGLVTQGRSGVYKLTPKGRKELDELV